MNRSRNTDPVAQPTDWFEVAEKEPEQDLDKLYAGVEYTLRMCEASLAK